MFPREDINKLLLYRSCDKATPRTYLSKFVLSVGITYRVRTNALHQLDITKFKHITINSVEFWRYTERVGSHTSASKVERGGSSATKIKPVTIEISNFIVLDDAINVYTEIDDYMKLQKSTNSKELILFLQISRRSDVDKLKFQEFFIDQPSAVTVSII